MIFRKKNADERTLQDVIDDLVNRMADLDKDSDEFETLLARLERLQKAQKSPRTPVISEDAKWLIGLSVGLATTLLIINAEHVGVITSKAFNRIPKQDLV